MIKILGFFKLERIRDFPNYETIYQKRLKQIQEDFPIPDGFINSEQFRSATGH